MYGHTLSRIQQLNIRNGIVIDLVVLTLNCLKLLLNMCVEVLDSLPCCLTKTLGQFTDGAYLLLGELVPSYCLTMLADLLRVSSLVKLKWIMEMSIGYLTS